MNRFAKAVKDLQIIKLTENIRMGKSPEATGNLDNNDHKRKKDIHQDNEDQTENKYAVSDEIVKLEIIPGRDEHSPYKQLYKCEECDARFKGRSGLYYHTSSKHEGICYSCKYCGYKATTKYCLKIHQESIHEGVKYTCDQCDNYFTQQSNLRTHKKSVHAGVRYSCDKCEYQATTQGHLMTHKNSVHGGVKYSCDQCNYQTGWKQNFKKHKAKHSLLA